MPSQADELPKTAAFWWLIPDIIPADATGIHKYVNNRRTKDQVADAASAERVETYASTSHGDALALLQTQMLGYRARSSEILRTDSMDASASPPRLSRVYASGGAAANKTILTVIADCLGCPVMKPVEFDTTEKTWTNANWNACSVGVAYKAKWGWERHIATSEQRKWIGFDQVVAECRERRRVRRGDLGRTGDVRGLVEEGFQVVAEPDQGRAKAYENSLEWWAALEKRALEGK